MQRVEDVAEDILVRLIISTLPFDLQEAAGNVEVVVDGQQNQEPGKKGSLELISVF